MGIASEVVFVACVISGLLGQRIARRKGQSELLGYAVGFALPVVGLFILEVLKDRISKKGVHRA